MTRLPEPLVQLHDVVRRYETPVEEVWAVKDVSFEAGPGELVCIHGSSGSGKSTLLNLIAGLDLPDAGRVEVAGHAVHEMGEDARVRLRLETIGVVFQEDGLIEEFTASENIALPMEARGMPTPRALVDADQLLSRVGLAGLAGRLPSQLSGGQRQRVGVARALAGGRSILLADEPTGALDSKNSWELFALLRSLSHQGACVIVCSHDPHPRDLADSVYEMVDGVLEGVRGAVV